MWCFNPASPKVQRTTIFGNSVLSPEGNVDPADDDEYKIYPADRNLPEHGYNVGSSLPGPLVRDMPSQAGRANYGKLTDTYYSNSVFYNRFPNEYYPYGYENTPYYRYNSQHFELPEYFIMDTTNMKELLAVPLESQFQSKYLMRRVGGLDGFATDGLTYFNQINCWVNEDSYAGLVYLGGNNTDLYEAPVNPACPTWGIVLDITNRNVPTTMRGFFYIHCRPWAQGNGGPNPTEPYSAIEWHIGLIRFDINEFYQPEIFTPRSGYLWNNGEKDRADQWHYKLPRTSLLTIDPIGPISTSFITPEQRYEVPINPEGDNYGFGPNHGTLNMWGVTEFLHTKQGIGNGSHPMVPHTDPRFEENVITVEAVYL